MRAALRSFVVIGASALAGVCIWMALAAIIAPTPAAAHPPVCNNNLHYGSESGCSNTGQIWTNGCDYDSIIGWRDPQATHKHEVRPWQHWGYRWKSAYGQSIGYCGNPSSSAWFLLDGDEAAWYNRSSIYGGGNLQ